MSAMAARCSECGAGSTVESLQFGMCARCARGESPEIQAFMLVDQEPPSPRVDWALRACRARAVEMAATNPRLLDLAVVDDRAQLLGLVDRMRPYLDHKFACEISRAFRQMRCAPAKCTCHLDDLLRELGEAGR